MTMAVNSSLKIANSISLFEGAWTKDAAIRNSVSKLITSNSTFFPHSTTQRQILFRKQTLELKSQQAAGSLQSFGHLGLSTQGSCVKKPLVVLTREKGKNGKLMNALLARELECLELPLIEHREGPDRRRLPDVLNSEDWEYIVITSPEAASVFLQGWKEGGYPKVRLAVVGGGTRQAFDGFPNVDNIDFAFTPSKANAVHLSAEIPKSDGASGRILYPASGKASHVLENGLQARGFSVTRLNTYSTESVRDVDGAAFHLALTSPVVTFASPTAVRAWAELISSTGGWDGAAVCIGSTSAEAARKAGLQKVYYPASPGIDGWVDSIFESLDHFKSKEVANLA